METKEEERSEHPLLGQNEENHFTRQYGRAEKWRYRNLIMISVTIISILLTFGAGFAAGSYATSIAPTHWTTERLPRVPVPWKSQRFVYNSTFAKAPREGNNNKEAWDTLIPKGRGWVSHPELTPQLSGISVFHQLHCLNDIRRLYYFLTNQSDEAMDIGHFGPNHMHHCFEYIRQELICAADSTLEPWQSDVQGASGWHVLRQCRDYDYLYSWAEKWRADEYEGF